MKRGIVELYEYQLDAIKKLKTGSILYGGVGSGKSITSLAYFYEKVCHGVLPINGEKGSPPICPKDLYIITTARKREDLSWEQECARFGLSTNKKQSIMSINVIIDSWNCVKKYVDVKDAFFIFDEQRVVGNGAWVTSFLKICKANDWIMLSATPGDTWTDYIPVFIANGFYKNRTDFIYQHVVYNRFSKYPKVDRYVNTGKLIKEQRSILVTMRYSKPAESHSMKIDVPYDRQLYDAVRENRWNVYENHPCKNAGEMCFVLRRLVNESSYRMDCLISLLERYPKVIIFYNFDYERELLIEICKAMNLDYGEWNGHEHTYIPNSNRWAYLVQYTAGAEGWNCTETNVMIFYSQNYSYKATKQAAGRIDRLNTPHKDLYYFYLISKAPIDRAIGSCLHRKRNFNEKSFLPEFSKKKEQVE